ncbi:TetR/AcrR family transcriptional regulator C-terminal domain-containing protein [uncultured Cellulomonas sp.]|uniref:TetR/AcrR family transcriptional regulator n=1 Tax=uncultured Cellulomonas sp. TaxID=189682 RepID=UPI0028EB011E|nr:TetR family transcriptional regulator [uncultured Cellulomonas sp.]
MDDVEAREAEEGRREAELLRRDREKAERAEAKEAERRRRDSDKADRDTQKAADRRERDRLKAEQDVAKEEDRRRREQERAAQQAVKEAARQLREAEKTQRAATLVQQQAAREAEKARRHAVRVAGADSPPVDLPPGLAVLWRTPAPGRPGPRPSLTLEQIADAGIALADVEGIGAVSMARIAESLGFTTMSLYRYVSSKDEVLVLMSDRASGRPPVVGPEVGGWRDRLELVLAVQQPILHAHPWLARSSEVLHAVGPSRLAWMEAMLSALDGTPLTEHQKVGAIGLLASHTLDQLRIGEELSRAGRTAVLGATDDGRPVPDLGELITVLASPAEHPALLRAAGEGAFSIPEEPSEQESELDFGTVLILDGIDRLIALAG